MSPNHPQVHYDRDILQPPVPAAGVQVTDQIQDTLLVLADRGSQWDFDQLQGLGDRSRVQHGTSIDLQTRLLPVLVIS